MSYLARLIAKSASYLRGLFQRFHLWLLGVHPIIHEAMRASFITQAEILEAEARQLE